MEFAAVFYWVLIIGLFAVAIFVGLCVGVWVGRRLLTPWWNGLWYVPAGLALIFVIGLPIAYAFGVIVGDFRGFSDALNFPIFLVRLEVSALATWIGMYFAIPVYLYGVYRGKIVELELRKERL